MNPNNLELAFYGELNAGCSESDVKANIAELFKASVEQVDRMFTGQRVVIRNKLDFTTAQKYVQAMVKRGAICKIEQMGKPGIDYKEAEPPQSSAVVQSEVASQSTATVMSGSLEPQGGLPVAGEEVDAILASSSLTLDPVGVRLSNEQPKAAEPALTELADIEILPPGSDLKDREEELPVSTPDTSHLSLKND